jgi:uncharacterized repeat protein (TIGR01451 family)
VTVTNAGVGGTMGSTTVVDALPSGLTATSAAGDGWSCSTTAAQVSCTRADSLLPENAFPPITILVQVAANAPAQIANTVNVSPGGGQTGATATVTSATTTTPTVLPQVTITKIADRGTADIGDTITYQVNIQNSSAVALANAVLHDRLPSAFRYVTGSARLDGALPTTSTLGSGFTVGGNGVDLVFQLTQIKPHAGHTLMYRARVGPDTRPGSQTNTATLTGSSPTGQAVTPVTATASVQVGANLLTEQRPLIGRVYFDANGNNAFDRDDVPVAGARVYLNDGQSATTDSEGLFSLPFVGDGSVVLALDPITLPVGYTISSEGERSGESWTRLVRTPLGSGTLVRQNFALRRLPGAADLPSRAAILNASLFSPNGMSAPRKPHEAARALPPPTTAVDPGSISVVVPTPGQVFPDATFDVVAYVANQWSVAVDVNGRPIASASGQTRSKLYPDLHTAAVTVAGVPLVAGPNTLKVCAIAPDKSRSHCADFHIFRSGPVKHLSIVPQAESLIASGRDHTVLTVRGEDEWGHPAADGSVTLDVSCGQLIAPSSLRDSSGSVKSTPETPLALTTIGGGKNGFSALPSSGTTGSNASDSLGIANVSASRAVASDSSSTGSRSSVLFGSGTETVRGTSAQQIDENYRQQILELHDGQASIQLRSSYIPGNAEIIATSGSREKQVEARIWIPMLPELRSPLLVGLGEVSIGHAAPEFALFNEGGNVERRGGFFYRGVLPGQDLLTLAYLSQRALNSSSGYQRMFDLDPSNQQYLVFGDSSTRSYNAQSNSHLYGRIDHGLSYLLFGDLSGDLAQHPQTTGISEFDRNITGLKLHVENQTGASLTLTGAHPDTAYARDVFPGTTLGLITLVHSNILAGSETVVLETRDRRNPEIIKARETLVRSVDYTMDDLSGAVFFLRSITALDSVLDLTQLVFTYEYRTTGMNSQVYRAQAGKRFDDVGLRVELNFLNERDSGSSYFLAGLEAEQKLRYGGFLRVEAPLSHGELAVSPDAAAEASDSGTHDGVAIRAEVEQPLPGIGGVVRAQLSKTDRDFLNPFGATVLPGAQTVTGSLEFKPMAATILRFGGGDERNSTSNVDNQRTTFEGSWKQIITDRLDLTAAFAHRDLMDHEIGRTTISNLITAGGEWRITDKLQVAVQREQNVSASDPTYPSETVLSGKYQLTDATRLFYTERIAAAPIIPIGDISGAGFAAITSKDELSVGEETRVARWTSVGTRYEIENGINGVDSFAILGVINRIPLNDKTSIDLGVEHALHIEGSGHDYNGATAALGWRPNKRLRLTERYELRNRYGFASLFSTAIAGRIADGVTALGQVQMVHGDTYASSTASSTTSGPGAVPTAQTLAQNGSLNRALAAIAVRPGATDRAGLLFSYNRQSTQGFATSGTTALPSTVGILSTDAWWNVLPKLDVYGRFAFSDRQQTETDITAPTTLTLLSQARVQYRFGRWFDAAAESRWLQQPATGADRQTTGVEIGGWILRDIRLALGYNFESIPEYGASFLASPIHRGVYFNLTGKFSRLFDLFGTPNPAPSVVPPQVPGPNITK